MKGKFITFEGSEGCGKSTQSRLLYEYLKKNNLKAIYLREPGGTEVGEKIRDILLDNGNTVISSECEMLLYMAARAQLVSEVIKPMLKKGIIVVCDRFLDSTIAYQGYGLGMDIGPLKYIGKLATENIQPNLTIFLDLPLKDGLRHRKLKEDRIEKRSLSYHNRVRKGYLALAARDPLRIKIVKVDKDKNKTQERIRELAQRYVF
ncbi:MAG: dTMP kinase [Candidatus Omnitrophota bacterium]